MNLLKRQLEVKATIERIAEALHVDPHWANAIAMTESSLGSYLLSPTGCRGVFQMSSIAMKDLLQEMPEDDLIAIVCGICFLRLLLRRHKTIEKATERYCDPKDRDFYVDRVKIYMKMFEEEK